MVSQRGALEVKKGKGNVTTLVGVITKKIKVFIYFLKKYYLPVSQTGYTGMRLQ